MIRSHRAAPFSLKAPLFALFSGVLFSPLAAQAPAAPAPAKPAATKPEVRPSPAQTYFNGLNSAWGYVLGQRLMLEQIGKSHPDLKADADAAWAKVIKGKFSGAIPGVEAQLAARLGDKFAKVKTDVEARVRTSLAERKFSREQSEAMIGVVAETFEKASLPEKTMRFLAASDPAFRLAPVGEFKAGLVRTLSTKDHPKANGVNLSMKLPVSWAVEAGNIPQMVWMTTSDAGASEIRMTLTIAEMPEEVNMEDFNKNLQLPGLKNLAPANTKLISARNSLIDEKPAGMLIYDLVNRDVPGREASFRVVQLGTTVERNYVIFQFLMPHASEKGTTINQLVQKQMPLFQQMIESVDFE